MRSFNPLVGRLIRDRAFFEPRFGHEFSQVRVHTDASAAQSAHQVNANAYTVGHNIVFGKDRFSPGTDSGRRLLAHELVHVVQQGSSAPGVDPPAMASGPTTSALH
jgi:hypothetical protein